MSTLRSFDAYDQSFLDFLNQCKNETDVKNVIELILYVSSRRKIMPTDALIDGIHTGVDVSLMYNFLRFLKKLDSIDTVFKICQLTALTASTYYIMANFRNWRERNISNLKFIS